MCFYDSSYWNVELLMHEHSTNIILSLMLQTSKEKNERNKINYIVKLYIYLTFQLLLLFFFYYFYPALFLHETTKMSRLIKRNFFT